MNLKTLRVPGRAGRAPWIAHALTALQVSRALPLLSTEPSGLVAEPGFACVFSFSGL